MDENKNNNNNLKEFLSETEEIISRLKEALEVTSDGHLAKNLGISRQNIGAARKRDDVPPGWIYKVAELTGCSMDWLRFGHGPKIRATYTPGSSGSKGGVANQDSAYRLQASWKPRSAEEIQQQEDISGFGAAVEMLAKIYSSKDQLLIGTINANIRAFCEAIDRGQREQRSSKALADLKKRLASVEKQLNRDDPGSSNKTE
jgi:hypothetical protein